MEKVETPERPAWLPEDQPSRVTVPKAQPENAVPWRTAGVEKTAVKAAVPPAAPLPPKRARRRSPLETVVLPLVFLGIVVLVIGGYLAGWHLG